MGNVSVMDYCQTLGQVYSSLTVPIPQGGLSTLSFATWLNAAAEVGTSSYNFGACPTWGLSDPFNTTLIDLSDPTLTSWVTSLAQTPGFPYHPIISPPQELLDFDPVWKTACSSFITIGIDYGVYDPPRALTPGPATVGSATSPVSPTLSKSPSTGLGPSSLPAETGAFNGETSTVILQSATDAFETSNAASELGSSKPKDIATVFQISSSGQATITSVSPSQATLTQDSQQASDPWTTSGNNQKASPLLSLSTETDSLIASNLESVTSLSSVSIDPMSYETQPLRSNDPQESQSLGRIIMSILSGPIYPLTLTQTKQVSPLPTPSMVVTQVTHVVNGQTAVETIFSVATTQILSPYRNAPEITPPSAQGSPDTDLIEDSALGTLTSASPSVFNIAGQLVTLDPSAVSVAIPETSSLIGGPSAMSSSSLDPTIVTSLIFGGQSFVPEPSEYSIVGTTVSVSRPGITIDGTLVSLPASDLVIGTSTMQMPPLKPSEMSAIAFDGQTIELNPTAITIDGTTMTPGGPGTTVHGIPLSLAASGLIVGSITIPQMQPVSIVSSASIVSTDVTAISISTMATTTLSPNGAEITVDGVPISLEPSELVIGSETVALGTGSSSLTGTANDHPSSSRMAASTTSKGGVVEMAVPRTWRLLSNMVLCAMLAVWASG